MANKTLTKAKAAKNDEFYTQFYDIETEMEAYLDYNRDVFRGKTVLLPCDDPEWSNFTRYFAQNFETLGLKKLISTSFAPESKTYKCGYQLSLFETESPKFDKDKTKTHGKIFVLTEDTTGDGVINLDDLQWDYLDGDGDFRSEEVTKLRDEADIIVTNPPFSLFREFVAWIMEANKEFVIIGNQNAITYKEIFPLLMNNEIWLGNGFKGGNAFFRVVEDRDNAIDVYMGDEYEDVLRDGEWQKRFKVKPAVFTREEKRAWLDGNTDVTLGSDAFFPFSDNVERAKKSGVKYIAQPGGSVRDDLVIECADQYDMVMSFTGIRLFHH